MLIAPNTLNSQTYILKYKFFNRDLFGVHACVSHEIVMMVVAADIVVSRRLSSYRQGPGFLDCSSAVMGIIFIGLSDMGSLNRNNIHNDMSESVSVVAFYYTNTLSHFTWHPHTLSSITPSDTLPQPTCLLPSFLRPSVYLYIYTSLRLLSLLFLPFRSFSRFPHKTAKDIMPNNNNN
jgi:hypothetical protein